MLLVSQYVDTSVAQCCHAESLRVVHQPESPAVMPKACESVLHGIVGHSVIVQELYCRASHGRLQGNNLVYELFGSDSAVVSVGDVCRDGNGSIEHRLITIGNAGGAVPVVVLVILVSSHRLYVVVVFVIFSLLHHVVAAIAVRGLKYVAIVL